MLLKRFHLACEVKAFADGIDALEYLSNHFDQADALPDVILLDVNMQFVDGWEFIRRYAKLKESLAKRPTIFIVSSSNLPTDLKRAEAAADVSGYLLKPLGLDALENALQTVFANP